MALLTVDRPDAAAREPFDDDLYDRIAEQVLNAARDAAARLSDRLTEDAHGHLVAALMARNPAAFELHTVDAATFAATSDACHLLEAVQEALVATDAQAVLSTLERLARRDHRSPLAAAA